MHLSHFAFAAAVLGAASLSAQNLVPEGDFDQGGANWSLISFNDPAGTSGFAAQRVLDQGPSQAVWANFQTLTSVRSATYRSQPFTIPAPTIPLGFSASWEKQGTAPILYPSVNRVDLRLLDSNLALVQTFTLQSPNQTGLFERAQFTTMLSVTPGTYSVEVFIRHSNLAGIPFTCAVDDVYIGAPAVSFFGTGCAGSGGFVPKLHTNGTPSLGNAGFAFNYFDGLAGGFALCTMGLSNTNWGPLTLPYSLGGGCNVLSEPMVALGQPVTGSGAGDGTASVALGIPNTPALVGNSLYSQWIAPDPAATNPFGVVVTAGMQVQFQP